MRRRDLLYGPLVILVATAARAARRILVYAPHLPSLSAFLRFAQRVLIFHHGWPGFESSAVMRTPAVKQFTSASIQSEIHS
jgi:hypothetical protein